MNKMINIQFWFVFFAVTIALLLFGCETSTPLITPRSQLSPTIFTSTQPLNTAFQYIHYIPPKALNINLEFDYPDVWVLQEITQYRGTGLTIISLMDPHSLALQTPSPETDISHQADAFGHVSILVTPLEFDQTLESEFELHMQINSTTRWVIPLNDYNATIDKYNARVLEYQVTPKSETYLELMFERETFFVVNNQLYIIDFVVPEKDRGGEFEHGYEYFLNSLKVVP